MADLGIICDYASIYLKHVQKNGLSLIDTLQYWQKTKKKGSLALFFRNPLPE